MIRLYHFYRAIFYSLYFPECFHFISIICLNILMIFLIIYSDLKQWFEKNIYIFLLGNQHLEKNKHTWIQTIPHCIANKPLPQLYWFCFSDATVKLVARKELSFWYDVQLWSGHHKFHTDSIDDYDPLDLEATAQHVNGLVYDIFCENTVLLLAWFLQWSGQPNYRRWASSSHNYPIVCWRNLNPAGKMIQQWMNIHLQLCGYREGSQSA